jgi:DMSO/TMAO reductase YedYZ molybdopterin-dependent catalytic subunit
MGRRSFSRRGFLSLAGGAALLPRALLAAAAETVPKEKRRMLQMNGYAIDAETPLDALTTYLTPNDLFFVRHHWNPMYPDARTWALTIDGEVETPLQLSLADLKKLPRAEATCVLQCAGNGRGLFRPSVPAFSGATAPSATRGGAACASGTFLRKPGFGRRRGIFTPSAATSRPTRCPPFTAASRSRRPSRTR